ncbi:MAG: pyridoxal phosphate-dependent aminotransferase [Desulfovibrionaceae bacterium]|nr:pyridoxal phosphate-dependent aminotransferase [Desulfovibrionaceae bacterium]
MRIAERLLRIRPSATLAINARAQDLRAEGREIISLAVGEPDFATPAHVCLAAKKALDQGLTRYTPVPGVPELRAAAAGYYRRFYSAAAGPEHIIVSNGGKQVLYNLCMALLNPGDQVLIPAPYWVSYPDMVMLAGADPVIVPSAPENSFLIGPRDLEAACTPRTRLLILNTPSNPTGCHYDQARLEEIADWARGRGVFVISDEVYDRLVYEPAEPASLSGFWSRWPGDAVVVGALSKSFCMTGWRVGFALAHEDLVRAMCKVQGQSTSNVNSVAQWAAVAALNGPWDLVEDMKAAFVRRRDLAHKAVTSWGAPCPKPDGAFYLFPVVDRFFSPDAPDSTALCARILDRAGVALVPGAAFGDDRCLRISYAVADAALEQALERIAGVLKGL